jgi:two-component system phosphate regulon sensor histidine kinase PhoR
MTGRSERLRTAIVYAIAVLVIAVYGCVRAGQVRHELEDVLLQSVSLSLPTTAADVTAWARSGQAQAELLARVLNEDLASPRGSDAARYQAILKALDRDDGFVASWMMDTSGRVLAASGDTSVAPSRGPPSAMLVRIGSASAIDLVAQAGRARVILRAAPRGPSFPELNPTRPGNRTGRTTLFYHTADSIIVALSRSNDRRAFPAAFHLPSGIRSLDASVRSQPEHGIADGVRRTPAAYAVAPLPLPGWSLLREQEVDEVLRPVWWRLAIEVALVGTVVLLLAAFVNYWWRASRLRREHELTRIRADFVASASHELRTPLAQIRMYAELLRKGSMRTPEDRGKALDVIEKEAHRLNILVDNVLNFTRLRRQTEKVPSVPTRVDDDIVHVVEAFAPLARERSVCIDTRLEPGLTAAVDSLALRQIVLNFLENAVKYGPVGQTVCVSASATGQWTRIAVEDHGPGVAPDEREVVWQPFSRGAAATAANTTGSGIGLAVVRDLVLQHGGRYAVGDTDAGTGARFVVEFPRFPRP